MVYLKLGVVRVWVRLGSEARDEGCGMGWRGLWQYWTGKRVWWLEERGCGGGLGLSVVIITLDDGVVQ